MDDQRRVSPAAERNRDPILAVLRRVLPPSGLVLEIASGTGQHAVHFAAALPGIVWQPSDPDQGCRASVAAWSADARLANLRPPLDLDVARDDWPLAQADAIVCINMIHVAPWSATPGLLRGAARLLDAGAPLVLHGPFIRAGRPTAPGNLAFDAELRARDPDWGVRSLEAVAEAAAAHGFRLAEPVEMPANNLTAIFRRT